MSHETTSTTQTPFERVPAQEFGYNIRQVDNFLARARATFNGAGDDESIVTSHLIRRTAFEPQKGGYDAREVDLALDRLEDVFAQREREALIEGQGEEAWLQQVGRLSAILRGRLHREPGERFRRPSRRGAPSYNVEDVDELCSQLVDYFENDTPMSVDVVRRATFREARGHEGYEESQVDAFLDRVVELMASID
ncbi:DivIVA domain-containing protein [Zafaria sp. Z1313]|uniref:DivIVA domain-containing protein n=1 Tax=unclassified Zafaria TaxID=2828765 RepID=UPI002E77FFBA|nr:DivIVA domain-containing protein [Zafaria sp. J156]MEE1620067.1 DivIVA domain-containing protein [Zafaria sp. J156]